VDNTPPTVAIGPPSVADTNAGPVDFALTYTGADTVNLTAGDVTLNTTGETSGTVSVLDGTTTAPTVRVSAVTGDGTLGITITGGAASDLAGNLDAGAGPRGTAPARNPQERTNREYS